jgi:hypothetical protein
LPRKFAEFTQDIGKHYDLLRALVARMDQSLIRFETAIDELKRATAATETRLAELEAKVKPKPKRKR